MLGMMGLFTLLPSTYPLSYEQRNCIFKCFNVLNLNEFEWVTNNWTLRLKTICLWGPTRFQIISRIIKENKVFIIQ